MSAMVKCLLCGKEFKNEAGLSGHIRMVHPDAVPIASNDLNRRLEAVELGVNNLYGLMEKVVGFLELIKELTKEMLKVEAELKAGAKTKKGGE